jgi:predicted ribosomally synthesized peptide with SipW-like signal peptide
MKKLKKILIPLFTVILVIAISIGATLAYLTDEESETNIMTIGKVAIDLLEYEREDTATSNDDAVVQNFHDDKLLLPAVIAKDFKYTTDDEFVDWTQSTVGWKQQNDNDGYTSPIWDPAKINNEVDKMVFLKNKGNYGAYVRIYFAFEAGNYATYDRFSKMIHINLNDTATDWKWEWTKELADIKGSTYFLAVATYQKVLQPGDFTEISLSQIALDPLATNSDVAAFGDTYNVMVVAQGIQQAGFTSIDQAFEEGFGSAIPFENLAFVTPINLRTALHYLDGNAEVTITDKVTNIIFGKTKDYADEVEGYNGVWIANEEGEADFVARAYYVPTADDKYDIYVLADGDIYTPNDSSELFRDMTSLTTVNTLNMNVSRTINASNMFRGCTQLTSVDVSKWDVSNVTNMYCMFGSCQQLQTINVSKWNTAKVTDMGFLFYDCQKLTSLDVSGWQVGKVISMKGMFSGSKSLTTLDVSKWNTSNVTDMSAMFMRCLSLKSLDVGNWDVSKVTTFNSFLSGFVIGDTSAMAIESINVDNWTTTSLTNMYQMFCFCPKLKTLNVKNWDVSKVTDMYGTFDNIGVTELDISTWNTANLADMGYMFAGSANLKTIYVGDGWSIAAATNAYKMFTGCINLKGGAGTTYKDTNPTNKTYARVDDPENGNPGYLTYKPAESTTPEQN